MPSDKSKTCTKFYGSFCKKEKELMQRPHQYAFGIFANFASNVQFDKFIVIDLVNVHSKLANFSHLSLIELSPSTCILMLHLVLNKIYNGIQPTCYID